MAGPARTTPDPVGLFDAIAREPWRYEMFQALRWIEAAHPAMPRLGNAAHAAEEPVRLGQSPEVSFAPASISGFTPASEGNKPRLEVLCFGLFGPNGPLPLHLSEYARDRIRQHRDPTFARFMDLFHHRMLCLFYRGWAAAQPTVQFDRPETNRFFDYIGAFIGVGQSSLRELDRVPDHAKLYYAGRLAAPTRNAEGLEAILGDYFKVPVRLDQFAGQWMEIPSECHLRLGMRPDAGTLGESAIVGSTMWECQHKFSLTFGPLSLKQYERFLPSGGGLSVVADWIRNYLGEEFTWEATLVLRRDEVPGTALGQSGLLGWTTWIGKTDPTHDPDDLTIDAIRVRRAERRVSGRDRHTAYSTIATKSTQQTVGATT